MQTDDWTEKTEEKQLDLINVEEVQIAKTVIYNWIKDLRAQPEVRSIISNCKILLQLYLLVHSLTQCSCSKVCGQENQ